MMETHEYEIGGLIFSIEGKGSGLEQLKAFKIFEINSLLKQKPVFTFVTDAQVNSDLQGLKELYRFNFEFDNMKSYFCKFDNGYCFEMTYGADKYFFVYEDGNPVIKSNLSQNGKLPNPSVFRFMLWTVYGLVGAFYKAIPIHSSVVCYNGRAVLCLGESGTGKSTHTRLWCENIENAYLLNDDSPIMRFENGKTIVYGSPWSGKTPCYKNERHEVAAVLRIVRASYNKMDLLGKINAFAAIQPSCPPAFAYAEDLADNIYCTISDIIQSTPVYNLNCLPNSEAAQLACKIIFG